MKICSKTYQITQFKIFFSGKHVPESLANAWLRHLRWRPAPHMLGSLGKSCIRPWTTTKKSYLKRCARRIHAGRQLIACSTLYVYALQNLFRGQKITKIAAQHTMKYNPWTLFSNTMCP